MPLIDDVNRHLRDFVRYTGDGLPSPPTGHPLPIGDPRSGTHYPSKADFRDLLLAILQAMGDPAALDDIINRLGTIETLTGAAGTGAAYTASGSTGFTVRPGVMVMFTPHADNTVATPTLSVSGSPAYNIGGDVGALGVGVFKAGVPVMLRFDGGAWRTVGETGAKLGNLTAVGGTSAIYTATLADVPLIPQRTMVAFTPHATNADQPKITIGGVTYPMITEDAKAIRPGQLTKGRSVLMLFVSAAAGFKVLGLSGFQPEAADLDVAREAIRVESQATHALREGGRESEPIYLNGFPRNFWAASSGDLGRVIVVGGTGNKWIDMRNLVVGQAEPSMIYVTPGAAVAKFIASDGKVYTCSGGMVRAWRPANAVTVFEGAVTEDVGVSAPVADIGFITAGQSLAQRFAQGAGIHGLQLGLEHVAGLTPSLHMINGAAGSTGLVPDAGATYWWNPATSTPGPAATAWKAALDARPVGQPIHFIYWVFGQNDAAAIGTTSATSLANYLASYRALFAWMRAQVGNASLPIIISPVGAWDNNVSPTDARIAAVRWAEMQLVTDANTHLGPQYWDLHRPFYDVHLSRAGQMLQGYRLASSVDNVLNGASRGMGPRVTKISEVNGGASFRVFTSQHSVNDPTTKPDFSDGFAVLPAGADPLSGTPVPIASQVWVIDGGQWALQLNLETPAPGGTVVFPWGSLMDMRRGRYPRTTLNEPVNLGWGNHWPLQPVQSGAFG